MRNNEFSPHVIYKSANIIKTRTLNVMLQASDIKNEDSVKITVPEIFFFYLLEGNESSCRIGHIDIWVKFLRMISLMIMMSQITGNKTIS